MHTKPILCFYVLLARMTSWLAGVEDLRSCFCALVVSFGPKMGTEKKTRSCLCFFPALLIMHILYICIYVCGGELSLPESWTLFMTYFPRCKEGVCTMCQ